MNRRKNIALIISIILNVAFVMFFVGKRVYYSKYAFFHPVPDKMDKLLKTAPDTRDVIFIGSSLTYSFPLDSAFKNPYIKNLGFVGITTSGLLTPLKKIAERHPQKIFLEAGINDIRKGLNGEAAYDNVDKMLTYVQLTTPQTTCYLQSILPTNSTIYNNKIIALNERLKLLSKAKGIIYINLYGNFLKHGELDSALTVDGIHLNVIGYYIWRKSIENHL
jgi:hypothetical protein